MTAAAIYTGLIDEPVDTDEDQAAEPSPLLDLATAGLLALVLLVAGLLAAIAARGPYGPIGAVTVLWASWSAVLVGLISYALRRTFLAHR